jgi:UDP-N-acetylglucosamine 2-epimerase (non-hydrolysing)
MRTVTEPRKICVVTGSRAEYGLLLPVMRAVAAEPALALQVVATGMHLAPEFGNTVAAIEADGIRVDARVEMLLSSDTQVGIAKSVGLGVMGFADAFTTLAPDMVLVLGDRFEILAAAQAAMLLNLPLVHLCGGDVTLGAFDESIRHAISKMAHLHGRGAVTRSLRRQHGPGSGAQPAAPVAPRAGGVAGLCPKAA